MKKAQYLILIYFFHVSLSYSQTITGVITDNENNVLPSVNVSIEKENYGVISKNNGSYSLKIKENRSVVVVFSCVGFEQEEIRLPMLKKGQNYNLNVKLNNQNNILNDIVVQDKKTRIKGINRIKPKIVNILPGNSVGVEAILKTLPGVSSANELSSQYSVRGGNFDENLVYVNGIEVYRPFLIHSAQQEGLSFVNTDMVSNIQFSAGGFEAKYGDKMSSVLDIKYKKPRKHLTSINMHFLGGAIFSQGINKKKNFTYLIGSRYKTNKYLFNAMDVKADYNPRFLDIQTYFNYKINQKINIGLLTNISQNIYQMNPKNRQTEFGTVNEALRLDIYFQGKEIDTYETYFGALNSNININKQTNLDFTISAFQTYEEENFDIIGEYWLYQLDNSLGSNSFGDIAFDRGVGKYINHARNKLNARVINFNHRGKSIKIDNEVKWGFKLQKENIKDEISEWNLIDSAFFNYPHPNDNIGGISNPNQQIVLNEVLKTSLNLTSYRNSAYLQIAKDFNNFSLNAGTRGSYWTFNEELLLSPRVSIAYLPNWKQDFVFRFASGIYYQSPFYKEIRNNQGILNYNVKAQKSIHYVLGSDYLFYKWGRPFKLVSEIYYKSLKNLIPYKIDNVRIQYLTNEISNGYASGIDLKINGEFVFGVDSWASISIMKTEEDIENDKKIDENNNLVEVGYIPRPTDQRLNFSMFFQDYVPGNPNFKIHLNAIYGSGLTFGPPKSEKYQDILRIPSYRRVDIGFSAVIKDSNKKSKIKLFNKLDSFWISLEVFNLLDINNTNSYIWVSDINNRQFAVPNYLTSRQLNLKLILKY